MNTYTSDSSTFFIFKNTTFYQYYYEVIKDNFGLLVIEVLVSKYGKS